MYEKKHHNLKNPKKINSILHKISSENEAYMFFDMDSRAWWFRTSFLTIGSILARQVFCFGAPNGNFTVEKLYVTKHAYHLPIAPR